MGIVASSTTAVPPTTHPTIPAKRNSEPRLHFIPDRCTSITPPNTNYDDQVIGCNGPIYRNSHVTYAAVTDGLSNTVVAGEKTPYLADARVCASFAPKVNLPNSVPQSPPTKQIVAVKQTLCKLLDYWKQNAHCKAAKRVEGPWMR